MQTWFSEFVETICPSDNIMYEVEEQSKFIRDQLVGKTDTTTGLSITGVFLLGHNPNCATIWNIKPNEYELDIYAYIEGKDIEKKPLPLFLKSNLETIYSKKNNYKLLIENNYVKMIINSGMKITLNIIPIILDISRPKYEWKGYILQKNVHRPIDEVPVIHDYVQTRTAKSRPPVLFNRMAKLINWWSKCQGLKYKNNEMIFLTGNCFDKNIFPSDWFKALDQVFHYFSHCFDISEKEKNSIPIMLDPINKEYNLLSNWSQFDIERFKIKAQESYDKLYDAKIAYDADNKKESINYLRDIFGREFCIRNAKT